MGFIKAFAGAIGGTFADQWLDFLTVPPGIPPTAAFFPAVPQGQNAGRGSNTKGSENIITNGSLIVVPEGYGLITMINGEITGFVTEAGGYQFRDGDQNSQTIFSDGFISPTIKTSWERFKFGGQPGAQHLCFFVNLKEIPNNRFGTQSEIYWDDAYLNAQVGCVTRGTYTMRIIDPILFVKGLLPATYMSADAPVFDFSDFDNPVSEQLFNEVVSSLAPAFSRYTNDPSKGNRITRIQGDSIGFAQSLSAAVEEAYQWSTGRGLTIESVAIQAIEYDEDTRELLKDVKKADALSGARSNSFLQQSVARGVQAAGENGGGAGMAMFGMGAGAAGSLANFQQPGYGGPGPYGYPQAQPGYPQQGQPGYPQGQPGYPQQGGFSAAPGYPPSGQLYPPQAVPPQAVPPQAVPPQGQGVPPQGQGAPQGMPSQGDPSSAPQTPPSAQAAPPAGDPMAQLQQWKQMLDAGLITQADFDAAKNKLLGL